MKRRGRLDNYFLKKQSSLPAGRDYFYLNWPENEEPTAEFLRVEPENVNFEKPIAWRGRSDLIVCGQLAVSEPFTLSMQFAGNDENPDLLALMKSHLQKCVRRRLREKALQTAAFLILSDFNLFARRLPLIMLEDARLHRCFPVLIWLTAALSKGLPVTRRIVNYLYSVVAWLCEEEQESFHVNDLWRFSQQDLEKLPSVKQLCGQAESFEAETRNLLLSLLLRREYGGLEGDIRMIMAYHRLISSTAVETEKEEECCELISDGSLLKERAFLRVQEEHLSHSAIRALVLDAAVRPMPLREVELCAVDFHCYPEMLVVLAREFLQFSEEQMRAAIWHFSSKRNSRVQISLVELGREERVLHVWQAIKADVLKMQQEYLNVLCNKYRY